MDQLSVEKSVREILGTVRTISVHNLSERTSHSLSDLESTLHSLEAAGVLRISRGKSCGIACSSCTSCESGSAAGLSGEEIIISCLEHGAYAVE